jgi:hypothetical protein
MMRYPSYFEANLHVLSEGGIKNGPSKLRRPDKMEISKRLGTGSSLRRDRSERRNELVRWDNGRYDSSPRSSIRDRLESLAKSSQTIANDVFRRAKVLKSSPFEALILKATWPDNNPVSPVLLEELVKYSIPAFKYARWVEKC